MRNRWLIGILLMLSLSACEQLGIETPAQEQARREAEAKAIGSACRHAGRAIEDCYVLNPKSSRAGIFDGWRDMDDYMRTNSIAAVAPKVAPNAPPPPQAKKKPKPTPEAPSLLDELQAARGGAQVKLAEAAAKEKAAAKDELALAKLDPLQRLAQEGAGKTSAHAANAGASSAATPSGPKKD